MSGIGREAYLDARNKIVPVINGIAEKSPYRERISIEFDYLKNETGLCVDALRTFFSSCGSAVVQCTWCEVVISKSGWLEVEHNLYNANPSFSFP